MTTTWIKNTLSVNSTRNKREGVSSDLGLFLDNSTNYIVDTEGNRIKVHTGNFYEFDTEWKKNRD